MPNVRLIFSVLLVLSAGACLAQEVDLAAIKAMKLEPNMGPGEGNAGTRAPDEARPVGAVLETRPPLNAIAKPAFQQQTRAPAIKTKTPFAARVVAHGFKRAWRITFLPDARMLVTEKSGRIRIVTQDGQVGAAITGVPRVLNFSDAGFFDIVLDPDFAATRRLFLSYVEYRGEGVGNGLTVASARLSADEKSLEDVKTIFSAPAHNNVGHYGGRMLVAPDKTLLVAVGDHFLPATRVKSQDIDSTYGKLLRINFDGSIPRDNPFAQVRGAEGAIWALGLRNVEGLSYDAKGNLWAADIGPQTGDELNIVAPGRNYGWPVIGYGTEYSGQPINGGRSQASGMEQPVYYWDPTIAPSGIVFYSGTLIPEWRGNLFVTALAGQHLARLVVRDDKVVGEERLLQDQQARFRDIAQGPDGALWALTDAIDGKLLRIAPSR